MTARKYPCEACGYGRSGCYSVCPKCKGKVERPISDDHHDSDRSTEPDPIVAERNAFKEKLKSINFGRVPGGARD